MPAPPKILCVGLNYDDHLEESGLKKPEYPEIFACFATSLIAHQEPIRRPGESIALDYEAELAVVIGKPGRRIPRSRPSIAWRDIPCSTMRPCVIFSSAHRNGRWARISMDTGSFGPWLVTPDAVPPGAGELLRCGQKGETREAVQEAQVADRIRSPTQFDGGGGVGNDA